MMERNLVFRQTAFTIVVAICASGVARQSSAQPFQSNSVPPVGSGFQDEQKYPFPGPSQTYPNPNQPNGPLRTPMPESGRFANRPEVRRPDLYKPAQIIARVGDQPIMLGDLLGQVNQILEPYYGKMPEYEMEKQREKLIKQLLDTAIENKLMYLEFLRQFPQADKLPEVEDSLTETFSKKQLPKLMEKAKVNTPGEYDLYLRRYGASLDKMKQTFIEQVLAGQYMNQNIERDPEITHEEMVQEYRRSITEYELPAKVRWEQLTVDIDKFPSRAVAWRAIASMGNEVIGGAPLAAVAKRSSQGFRASEGGYHDWTTKGSLVSEVLDHKLFELPIGKLSRILEDDGSMYIIRVIERTEATRVPFTEAQVEIKEKLKEQKVKESREQFAAKVRDGDTMIWTIFDEQLDGPQSR